MADKELKAKQILLKGKLRSSDDSVAIGEDFQQLTNLRYTDTHPQGVSGMTKINTTALSSYPTIKSGFHLRKDLPAESNVVVQAFNSGGTEAKYYKNSTAIPSAGDFTATALLTQSGTPGTANWSKAPNGNLVMCDGKGTYIWGGSEIRVGSFINYSPDNSFWYNYTDRVQNDLSTGAANLATMYRVTESVDSDVMLLLHLNNNVTDTSPATIHTVANYTRSNGSISNEHMTTLTGWADGDGAGAAAASTQGPYGGYETFKFDGGTAQDGTAHATRTKDVGTIGDTAHVISIRMYNDLVGALAADDEFRLTVDGATYQLIVKWCSDGLFVYDGASYNEVGTNIVNADAWNEWTFDVDATTPGSATCTVYKNGVSQATGVDCSNVPTGTDGTIELKQNSQTTASQISYVDWVKVGLATTAVTFSTTKVFGTHSAVFSGADWLEIPDDADFDFSAGIFTIDGRFRVDNLTTNHPIWYQQIDRVGAAEDTFLVHIDTNGAVSLSIYDDGAQTIALATPNSTIAADTWYHIAIVENGDDWYIFVDGILKGYLDDSSRAENYTSAVLIGRSDGAAPVYYDGFVDELRVSDSARWTTNFEVPLAAYASNTYTTYLYVGSPRPLQGIKFYIGTANATAGTSTVEYWAGSSFTEVGSLSDGTTASSSKPLAVTGTMSFDSTEAVAEPSIIDGIVLYWYRISISELDATTTVYSVSLDAPMQTIKDTWDGIEVPELSFKHWDDDLDKYIDFTTNVYEDSYVTDYTNTYAELDSATTSDHLIAGFATEQMGLVFRLIPSMENSTANTIATIYYWNGTAWATVGTLTDGTSENSISFAKSGTISWNPVTAGTELKKEISNEVPLYYYKISFSQALDSEVELYYVAGITAPITINAFKYPFYAGDSVWLLNELNKDRNRVLRSVPGHADTWNGDLALSFTVGDDKDLIAGEAIYMQIGTNLYEVLVLCKKSETWMVIPGVDSLEKFLVDATKGCTAAGTMRTASLGAKDALGTKRNVVIWQGTNAIHLYDGRAVLDIDDDIADYFDRRKSYAINTSYVSASQSFFDENNHYHWKFASGTSTTLNKELVYDTDRSRWYEIDRGTAKYLQCGIEVEDTNGNKYSYGAISQYMERLENGTDFDGTDITHTLHTGDIPVAESIAHLSKVDALGLTCLATNTTTNTISGSYYRDGATTADETFTLAPQKTGKRIATPTTQDIKQQGSGIYHSFKLVMITDDETIGFEPMYLYAYYKVVRSKLLGGS